MGGVVTCGWQAVTLCPPVEWLVARACGACASRTVLGACGHHYRGLRASAELGLACCPGCFGALSFVSHELSTGAEEEHLVG